MEKYLLESCHDFLSVFQGVCQESPCDCYKKLFLKLSPKNLNRCSCKFVDSRVGNRQPASGLVPWSLCAGSYERFEQPPCSARGFPAPGRCVGWGVRAGER